jgi:hypothetical protein
MIVPDPDLLDLWFPPLWEKEDDVGSRNQLAPASSGDSQVDGDSGRWDSFWSLSLVNARHRRPGGDGSGAHVTVKGGH